MSHSEKQGKMQDWKAWVGSIIWRSVWILKSLTFEQFFKQNQQKNVQNCASSFHLWKNIKHFLKICDSGLEDIDEHKQDKMFKVWDLFGYFIHTGSSKQLLAKVWRGAGWSK